MPLLRKEKITAVAAGAALVDNFTAPPADPPKGQSGNPFCDMVKKTMEPEKIRRYQEKLKRKQNVRRLSHKRRTVKG